MGIATIILLGVLLFGIPSWISFVRRNPSSRLSVWAAVAIAFSTLVQMSFVLGVAMSLFTLDYSLRFAMVGVPLCIAGGIIGMMSRAKAGSGTGYLITATFTIVCWMFLITLH